MFHAIITTLPFFAGLFWFILLAHDFKKGDKAKQKLTFFMLACTILYFSHTAYYNHEKVLFGMIEGLYAFCNLAVFPMYYLYICRLTDSKSFHTSDILMIIPATLVSIAAFVFYAMMDQELMPFIENRLFCNAPYTPTTFATKAQCIRITVMKFLFWAQQIPVLIFGFKKLNDFDKKIKNFYSNTEGKSLSPIKALLIIFVVGSLCSALATHIGREFFANGTKLLAIPSFLFGSMLFAIGYIGYKQDFSVATLEKDVEKEEIKEKIEEIKEINEKQERIETRQDDPQALITKICKIIEEEGLYRQKGLLITDLARRVGSNRTYVSNCINKEMKLSFSELINKYRVEHAKELLRDTEKELKVLDIVELCGFSSDVSFYRVFKKFTGKTPKDWAQKG